MPATAGRDAAKLCPPQYSQNTETAFDSVTVTLLKLARPSMWDVVSDWIDREGPIANSKLREISGLDTLAASKKLKSPDWPLLALTLGLTLGLKQARMCQICALAHFSGSRSVMSAYKQKT